LAAIDKELGIITGHIETVHAYTNDQNLVDNIHKKYRRGRAAALNMVITETGAGTAVSKVLPSLAGKLTSNAVRVPIPNGSLAILQLEVEQPCTAGRIHDVLLNAALNGPLVEQIKYENNPDLVSSDIIGTTAAAVVDAPATIVSSNGKNVVIYVWYDNEYGYVNQVMRLARHQAGVRQYSYY
jgi:glyceraldehyde 3-phosphate dehydrogenase